MSAAIRAASRVRIMLDLVKFEHTVFALPFALMSALVAANGWPAAWTLCWLLVAMVGARSSAMAVNRLADLEYDRRNPRTADRALPRGLISPAQVWIFVGLATAAFVLAAAMLNRLALALSPVALAIIWGYSFTKRFTVWSHWLLGLSLGIAPVGAWIAVTGRIGWPSLILSAAVLSWTAGFDIIYGCQDVEFDRREGLASLPARWGTASALAMSAGLHLLTIGLLLWWRMAAGLGDVFLVGLALVAAILAYEHILVKPSDLSRANAAFFTANGIVSVALLGFAVVDVWLSQA